MSPSSVPATLLPPRVGAYLLANHSSHASLLTTSSQERSHFTVRQNALFRAPSIINNPVEVLTNARNSAAAGRLMTAVIPDLADPGPEAIQRRLTWTLCFFCRGRPPCGGGKGGPRQVAALHVKRSRRVFLLQCLCYLRTVP